ncbi:hypothetical protein Prudu_009111 [Prunus dulcis]|uniref:Integrase catalytic domain-containing protein n=1 Tax=Prunus dulcis TaxID=3755 RepID=A0A4Y1R5M5_PRUDU|nr:hypothetical protein Prudu_009111 [Prunus dulcis]
MSCHLVLKDARLVLDMRLNLISTGLLDDEGYINVFAEGKWKLSKNFLVLARGKKENTLYMTHAKVSNGYLGHTSKKGLQILAKREALTGMKKGMPLKSCTYCLDGKQHRASFQHGHAQRKPNVLDVVYSDVCGPMTTCKIFCYLHWRSFQKVWAYALRMKDQVYEVFKQFHDSVERETGRSLKCIRTDNGGEYMGMFRNYCRNNGIRHERSVLKTPQHNGIAERMNRTMLSHAKLPKNQNIEDIRRGDKPDNPKNIQLTWIQFLLHWSTMTGEMNPMILMIQLVILLYINEPVDDDMSDDHTADGIVDDVADEGLEAKHMKSQQPIPTKNIDQDGGEPECYKEALTHDQQDESLKAMHEKMQSLHENHTYNLVNLPKGRIALKNKWVYRLKTEENNSKPSEDVIHTGCIGLVTSLNLEIEQLDVKTTFLHGDLEEEIYMEQPEGFKVKGKKDLVCQLKKSLYGLKQVPRQWYKKFDSFMIEHRYRRTTSNHCAFVKRFDDGEFIILLLYVDDMLIVGQNSDKIRKLKKELSNSFAMKDLGPTKRILSMSISRDRKNRKLRLSQESYVREDKAKPVSTPFPNLFKLSSKQSPTCEKGKENMAMVPYSSVVGSLMYAMICTRPDITHAVGVVSRFLSKPGREHWNSWKWILRYLRGTSKMSLCFGGGKPALIGYTDADMAEILILENLLQDT